MKMNRTRKSILGIVSIAIGGIIYILWREQSLLMFEWFKSIGVINIVESMRSFADKYYSIFPKWVYFSLPNALWLFGGILLFASIWKHHCYEQYFWIGIFVTIAIGSEFGQLLGVTPGTWDNSDMLFMIVSIVCAITLNRKGVGNVKTL